MDVWQLPSGKRELSVDAHKHWVRGEGHQGWMQDLALFADGLRAVSTSSDGTLRVWNLQSGRKTRCVDYNKAPLHAVAITPDETTVLTSFQIEDGRDTIYGIIHWDVATWQRKALQVDDHEGRTKGIAAAGALAVTSDGRFALAPEPYVSEWNVWRLSDRQTVHRRIAGGARVNSAMRSGEACALVALNDSPTNARVSGDPGTRKSK